jgi:hypothetical protein
VTGRGGTLGNSNERGTKGFVTTYALPRTLGVKGKFKLDWVFVKAYLKDDTTTPESYLFAPSFARSMNEVNGALEDPLRIMLAELFLINSQADLLHFLNFRDHDCMSPGSLKHNPARPHVFADEWHQFLPLIRVRHFGRDGEIQPTILGQNN